MRAFQDDRCRLAIGVLGLVVMGCSNEGTPSSPPPPPARPAVVNGPPRPNRVQQDAPQVPLKVADRKPTDEPRKLTSNRPLPPNADPKNVFLALAVPRGNFVIVEGADPVQNENWFFAMQPAAGADSTSFHAIPPEGTRLSFAARSASLPEGFVAVESAGVTNDGWPQRIRCEADGAEMAFVPGGTFLIGLKGQSDHALPAHPVDLDPYYIDVTEVTLGQYRKFMDAMLDERRLIPPPVNDGAAADHPVLGVEWGEVIRYARWAGKSLPTEAEWELAARGPDSFNYPWGNGRAVWDGHREPGQIDAVGTFSTDRSVFGVLDMAGNASEWVYDHFDEQPGEPPAADNTTTVKNPAGPRRPSIANHRVVKGGSPQWDLWHRSSANISQPPSDLGFRCVLRVSRNGNTIEARTIDGDTGDDDLRRGRTRRPNRRRLTPGL